MRLPARDMANTPKRRRRSPVIRAVAAAARSPARLACRSAARAESCSARAESCAPARLCDPYVCELGGPPNYGARRGAQNPDRGPRGAAPRRVKWEMTTHTSAFRRRRAAARPPRQTPPRPLACQLWPAKCVVGHEPPRRAAFPPAVTPATMARLRRRPRPAIPTTRRRGLIEAKRRRRRAPLGWRRNRRGTEASVSRASRKAFRAAAFPRTCF